MISKTEKQWPPVQQFKHTSFPLTPHTGVKIDGSCFPDTNSGKESTFLSSHFQLSYLALRRYFLIGFWSDKIFFVFFLGGRDLFIVAFDITREVVLNRHCNGMPFVFNNAEMCPKDGFATHIFSINWRVVASREYWCQDYFLVENRDGLFFKNKNKNSEPAYHLFSTKSELIAFRTSLWVCPIQLINCFR